MRKELSLSLHSPSALRFAVDAATAEILCENVLKCSVKALASLAIRVSVCIFERMQVPCNLQVNIHTHTVNCNGSATASDTTEEGETIQSCSGKRVK